MNSNFVISEIAEASTKKAGVEDGIELCRILRDKLVGKGIFPALTGGLLYKEGNRKDIDIVLYRHRQDVESFETIDFEQELSCCGLTNIQFFGFVTKAQWRGIVVDLFNPETRADSSACNYGG